MAELMEQLGWIAWVGLLGVAGSLVLLGLGIGLAIRNAVVLELYVRSGGFTYRGRRYEVRPAERDRRCA